MTIPEPCPEVSRTKEGWRALVCRLPVGHDGPHADPESEQFSRTGFWWGAGSNRGAAGR